MESLVIGYLQAMQIFCAVAFVVCGSLAVYFFLSSADFVPQLTEEIYKPILPPSFPVEIPDVIFQYEGKRRELKKVKRSTVVKRAAFLTKATGKKFNAYYYCAGAKFFESWEICREDKEASLRRAICLSDDSHLIRIS